MMIHSNSFDHCKLLCLATIIMLRELYCKCIKKFSLQIVIKEL